jgi:hypothetical protein
MYQCSVLKLECALTTNIGKHISGIKTLALQIKNKEFIREKYITVQQLKTGHLPLSRSINYHEQF